MKRKAFKNRPASTVPPRVAKRSSPNDYDELELITLPEAAALFWPDGLITTTTLRTAVRDKQLPIVVIAGKIFTNKAGIRSMSACSLQHADDLPATRKSHEDQPTTVSEFRRKLVRARPTR